MLAISRATAARGVALTLAGLALAFAALSCTGDPGSGTAIVTFRFQTAVPADMEPVDPPTFAGCSYHNAPLAGQLDASFLVEPLRMMGDDVEGRMLTASDVPVDVPHTVSVVDLARCKISWEVRTGEGISAGGVALTNFTPIEGGTAAWFVVSRSGAIDTVPSTSRR